MGQHHSELDPVDLQTLHNSTPFTKEEITTYYQDFLKHYPTGLIARDDLRKVYKKSFPKGNPDDLVEEMFRIYDRNMSGRIDFREFLCGLGFMAYGNDEDRLKLAFSFYDNDESGSVTIDELRTLVQAIYKATAKKAYNESEAINIGSSMFAKLDENSDGRVTLEEFIEVAKNDDSIMNLIKMFNPENISPHKKH